MLLDRVSLFIEILLESRKLVLLSDTALPPRLYESEAISHKLDKGGGHTEDANLQTLVAHGGVDQNDE